MEGGRVRSRHLSRKNRPRAWRAFRRGELVVARGRGLVEVGLRVWRDREMVHSRRLRSSLLRRARLGSWMEVARGLRLLEEGLMILGMVWRARERVRSRHRSFHLRPTRLGL